MKTTIILALAAGLGGAACKKASAPKPGATTSDIAATKPGATVPPAAADAGVATTDASAATTVPTDVPPFAKAASVDQAKIDDLLGQANRALDGGDGDAIALALAAVKLDPGRAEARALLARAVDDPAFSLAQLTPLTTATDCRDCADVVRDLARSDWPDAVAALATTVTPSPQRAAAEALIGFFGDGDATKVAAYFRAPKVESLVTCSVCDGNEGDVRKKMTGAKLVAALAKQIATAKDEEMGGIVVGGSMTCANDCCAVAVGMLQHNHDFFESVCFAPGTDQISKLSIISGG